MTPEDRKTMCEALELAIDSEEADIDCHMVATDGTCKEYRVMKGWEKHVEKVQARLVKFKALLRKYE